MKIIIIAAISNDNAIGRNNDLLWKLPNDMKFFKEKTAGSIVITGRKNYESIPEKFRPLPNRINIVVTKQKEYDAKGAYVVATIEEAIQKAKELNIQNCFVIGGGEIYRQTIELADELYITHVDANFPDADVFFPTINESWWNTEFITKQDIDEKHQYAFNIVRYERPIKPGDKVKMSEKFKQVMHDNGCADHVEEFGNCIGVVENPMFPGIDAPEFDVRWQPSGLRYGYNPLTDLIKINEL